MNYRTSEGQPAHFRTVRRRPVELGWADNGSFGARCDLEGAVGQRECDGAAEDHALLAELRRHNSPSGKIVETQVNSPDAELA